MTAPLFAAHPGCHCAARERAPFFRQVMRLVLRKPLALAGPVPAGAPTALPADRFKCCVHCEIPTRCDPPDSHPKACSDGCNRVAARNDVTAPSGWPVLGERMLSEVRAEWDRGGLAPARQAAHADAMHAMSARFMPAPPRPVNGRKMPDQPRQRPVPYPELRRRFGARPGPELLKQVLAGLEAL